MEFDLDESFEWEVTIYKEWSAYSSKETLTNDELVKVLKGLDRCNTRGSDDHPEFKKLRNKLEDLGYIKTERGWWNGDRVLKPFKFNSVRFDEGEQFPSGAAMKHRLEFKRKYNESV